MKHLTTHPNPHPKTKKEGKKGKKEEKYRKGEGDRQINE